MREPIIQLAQRRQQGQHPSLILQRYLTRAVTGVNGDPRERKALLDAVIHAGQSQSLRTIYADAYARWDDSFPKDDLNLFAQLSTASRLVVGLGSENVLETGIRLHHTFGVPLIPGSALKGLASHYCHAVWGQRHVALSDESNRLFRRGERYHRLLFGTTEDGGVITFQDAWITPRSLVSGAFHLDVMTPHHPKWQTNEAPPTDFDSPVPLSFLTVSGTFQVRLSWSGPIETPREQSQAWTRLAMQLVQEALTEWGVGGKASSGYGRLITADAAQLIPAVPRGIRAWAPDVPKAGVRVEAVLLNAKTKKGGWKAKHEPSGLAGPVQNSADVPADKKVGDSLTLIVASANQREIAFRYPTAADEQTQMTVNNHEHTLLICTVGGTPEPLVKSLLHWQPARTIFVPSQQTGSHVDAVLRAYAEHAGQPLSPGCYRISAVEDAEDLDGCLQTIRALDNEVRDWVKRSGDYQVVADITAGTKCMSAALALQARRWNCRFAYVGGARRTKEGVGLVETGSERVVHSVNPWDALGFQVVEDTVTVFNHGGYAAAVALLDRAMKRVENPGVKRALATLQAVVDGYALWDRFDHKAAQTRFDDALKNRNDLAAIFADERSLIGRIERHRESIAELTDQNESAVWIADLICNAYRRATECRYDDAVARLYRAFEALAQIRLRDAHGIPDTKSVPLKRLPDSLRAEWIGRARDGVVLLGLRDAYCLLKELGDDLGRRFWDLKLADDQNSPLVGRNQSILAHGFQSVSKNVYKQLLERLRSLAEFEDSVFEDWRLPPPR